MEIYLEDLVKGKQEEVVDFYKDYRVSEIKDFENDPLFEIKAEEDSDMWTCSECEFGTHWSYRELVEKGNPICPKCDIDLIKN